jgi:hypothetical protein
MFWQPVNCPRSSNRLGAMTGGTTTGAAPPPQPKRSNRHLEWRSTAGCHSGLLSAAGGINRGVVSGLSERSAAQDIESGQIPWLTISIGKRPNVPIGT